MMTNTIYGGCFSAAEFLQNLHQEIKASHPEVGRIGVAIYDKKTDLLKSFAHSTDGPAPINNYSVHLQEVPSLKTLAEKREFRVVDDIMEYGYVQSAHTLALRESRLKSSYTVPFYHNNELLGFIFFNANIRQFFTSAICDNIELYARLAASSLTNIILPARTLIGSIQIARSMSHFRDVETGAHLDRMSSYSWMIGNHLAKKQGLPDEFPEYIRLFAPLHDIGKIAVPDALLRKQGKFSPEEKQLMQSHVNTGVEIVEQMLSSMHLDKTCDHLDILRNVVRYHHEYWDGNGYIEGLRKEEIPLEARIVSLADVFDALTSKRPYKEAWSNEKALDYIREQNGKQFDPQCVTALLENSHQIENIQSTFQD